MKSLRRGLRLLLALFAGSLWAVLWSTAILFAVESNRHIAGIIAARLFTVQTVLGLGVSLFAALQPDRRRFRLLYVATALLVVNEWVLKPVMESARLQGSALGLGFGPWHGISALLYLVGCACAAVLIWNDDLR